MKFKHVVLFGVVASIMSYLNNAMEAENEPDKQEKILNELKDLLDNKLEDVDLDKKLDELKAEVPEEHFEKATEMAKDVTDNLIEELNSIVESLGDITNSAVDAFIKDEIEEEPSQEEVVEEEVSEDNLLLQEEHQNLVSELENIFNEDEEVLEPVQSEEETSEADIEDEAIETSEISKEVTDEKEELINELEELLASLEKDENEEALNDFSEDDYLSQIKEAINNTIILNEDGDKVDMTEVFDEEPNEINQDEIDEIFSEILKQEGLLDEKEVLEEETDDDSYLDDLVDELNDAMSDDSLEEEVEESEASNEEETPLETEEDEEIDIYGQINELYPYLSRGFVRAVYDLKESIANEYPVNYHILILHRLSFNNIEDLRQFAEIVLSHDYRVNVDENKMIVDIFKEVINTDGKILTNIFEIANQAKLLDGNYEGYRIEIL